LCSLLPLAGCDERAPPSAGPATPPVAAAAAPDGEPCGCGDRNDLELRLAVAEATIEQIAFEEARVRRAYGEDPSVTLTPARKDTFKEALERAQAAAGLRSGLSYSGQPFPRAQTHDNCEVEIAPTTRCLAAGAREHEEVHVRHCRSGRPPQAGPSDRVSDLARGWRYRQPLLDYMREESRGYAAEAAFYRRQLERLRKECRGYSFGRVVLRNQLRARGGPAGANPTFTVASTVENGLICPFSHGVRVIFHHIWETEAPQAVRSGPISSGLYSSCSLGPNPPAPHGCYFLEFSLLDVDPPGLRVDHLPLPNWQLVAGDSPAVLPLTPTEECRHVGDAPWVGQHRTTELPPQMTPTLPPAMPPGTPRPGVLDPPPPRVPGIHNPLR
jgi:hypothetical protein